MTLPTSTLLVLRTELRRRMWDVDGGKFVDDAAGNAFLNDAVNKAISHAAPYVGKETKATATVTLTGAIATITLPATMSYLTEVAVAPAVAGYPPTPIEPSLYHLTRAEDGTSTVTFDIPYATSTIIHCKGLQPYATLASDTAATPLDADYILHYAMGVLYEDQANKGGMNEAKREMTNLAFYHFGQADRILLTQANNPFLRAPKRGKEE